MLGSEDDQYKAGWGQTGLSLLQVAIGVAMVVMGSQYLEEVDCRNGANIFLFYGGMVTIIGNGLGLIGGCGRQLALKDGRVSCGEGCCLCLLGLLAGLFGILDLITLIWGSVVVFSSWPDWTMEDPLNQNYCKQAPMMFAFVLLILRWTLLPLLCCCICCAGCAKHANNIENVRNIEGGHTVKD